MGFSPESYTFMTMGRLPYNTSNNFNINNFIHYRYTEFTLVRSPLLPVFDRLPQRLADLLSLACTPTSCWQPSSGGFRTTLPTLPTTIKILTDCGSNRISTKCLTAKRPTSITTKTTITNYNNNKNKLHFKER